MGKLHDRYTIMKGELFSYYYRILASSSSINRLHVVLDWKVLAAHHTVTLEPLAAELLGCSFRCVGPFDGDTIVVGRFRSRIEGVTRDGDVDGLLRVENTVGRVHVQTARVGRLEGETDTMPTRVDDL
uniref:Uncharacterized protein n=1 Tax=Meloidogyne incognita TaxID=6306 RepID=A0A914KZ26_MELIC